MLRIDFNLVLTMINLVILFLILRKFLFRPIMNIMEKREAMISDGLKNAEDSQNQALELKSQYEEKLKGAGEESSQMIERARQEAKAEYDRRYVRTEAYLTAQLLQGLHGYYCGNKRLFELSESFRNNLVHHAKCMGLFRYKPDPNMLSEASQNVEERWKEGADTY